MFDGFSRVREARDNDDDDRSRIVNGEGETDTGNAGFGDKAGARSRLLL